MTIARLNASVGGSCINALKTAIDAGSGPGTIKIYTGTMPATPDTAITSQTLLGTLTCADPCGTVSGKTLTFSAITQDSSADAGGIAAWARIADSAGVAVIDIDVGLVGSGAALQMNTTTIVTLGPIGISTLSIAFP